MRGLSPSFLHDLQHGFLHPLLERVHLDRTLCLELRDDYLNLYYRGGSLLRLAQAGVGYTASFDTNYTRGEQLSAPATLSTDEHVSAWLSAMPHAKQAMDLFMGRHPKEEREIQQLIARDNNIGSTGRSTDFYICDVEYASPHGRFDLVGVHWPSTGVDRKRSAGRRLVIGKVKQGDNALADVAGLHAHLRDVEAFLAQPENVATLQQEMLAVFNQKRALGVLNCGRDLESFSDEPPLFLLVFANHDPDSRRLRDELASLPSPQRCEVRIATASLVGYGLYDPGLITVDEALARPETSL